MEMIGRSSTIPLTQDSLLERVLQDAGTIPQASLPVTRRVALSSLTAEELTQHQSSRLGQGAIDGSSDTIVLPQVESVIAPPNNRVLALSSTGETGTQPISNFRVSARRSSADPLTGISDRAAIVQHRQEGNNREEFPAAPIDLSLVPPTAALDAATRSPRRALRTNPAGIQLIKRFEGLRLQAYQSVPGGPWEIGYGHTGPEVVPGLVISVAQAEAWFREDLREFEAGVKRLVNVRLNSNQFSALVSFTYNVGLGAFANSTLLERLNNRNYRGAAREFRRWVFAGGVVLPGLVARRSAERALFLRK